MQLSWAVLLVSAPLFAQEAPIGIVRGQMLECRAGQLSIRSTENQVFQFVFDDKTYFEREKQRISSKQLRKDDQLEIVSDSWSGGRLRYARMVQVVEETQPRRRALSAGRFRPYRSPLDDLFPRGNLTFAGVVSRINDERLVLHTRADGEKSILLREDTAYLEDGTKVGFSNLKPNTRVFVRAGKNLDDDLEAYQVVWGQILEPGR